MPKTPWHRGAEGSVAFTNLRDGKLQGSDAGLETTGLETVGVAIAIHAALVGSGSDVRFAFEQHGGVHEDFSDSGEGVFEAVVEKEVDEWILVGSLFVFVHCWCWFGLSTFSIWSWTDAYNPRKPGSGRRAAALAADSATLHRLPVPRAFAG